ncbi:MAG TPA: hypothetical protein VI703_00140 [Anaerolineales bacterium]|jgi:hypothetical protein|nr:hypothetical protein [Anaerolineales bacterium]
MAASPLAKKMKFDTAKRAAIINPPDGYLNSLKPFPKEVELLHELSGKFDWIQLFVKNKAEFDKLLPKVLKAIGPESRIWISFPKGSSKMQTDLTRDKGWDSLKGVDLKFVNLIAVNEAWSAFNLRTYKPGEERQSLPWD